MKRHRVALLALLLVAIAAVLLFTMTAHAGDLAVTCQTGKLSVTGKFGACRLAAEAKAVKAGGVVQA